jgi:protoporphyrinogen oxidase
MGEVRKPIFSTGLAIVRPGLINRFGRNLYQTFFKSYTEKVWGVPCNQISAEWGAQRIKGLSVWSTLRHAMTYPRFAEIREHMDRYTNLFLIGRNGMHRYNNQDHSMLTAMMVVDGLVAGNVDKSSLWEVNTELDYQEAKS